jgi:hypothetical protein
MMRARIPGVLAFLSVLVPAAALADGTCKVVLIRASHGAGGIEARLQKIRPLAQPPLSLFREMRLLDEKEMAVAGGNASTVRLSNGWTLRLRETGRSPEGTRYEAVVQRPGGPDRIVFTAARGAPFFTVIQRGQEAFILGFTFQ